MAGDVPVFQEVSRQIGKDITVRADKKIQFRDSGIYIQSSADGKLLISADGSSSDDITFSGTTTFSNDATFSGNVTIEGTFTFADAVTDVLILKGRVATDSASGGYLDIDSTYTYNELFEIKADVSDWSNISANYDSQQQFIGVYSRVQSAIDDAQGWLIGVQGWATANGAGFSELTGVFGYAYGKGDTTDTVGEAYGVRGEFSMDAGRSNTLTITTEAAGVLSYITSGKVDDYTKIHGYVFRPGDMDGGSRTYGSVLRALEGVESGTSAMTNFLYTDMACTSTIEVSATGKGGVTVGTFSNDTIGTTTEDGYFTVKVGATSYKVPFWEDDA